MYLEKVSNKVKKIYLFSTAERLTPEREARVLYIRNVRRAKLLKFRKSHFENARTFRRALFIYV